jgi:hypothetical protein
MTTSFWFDIWNGEDCFADHSPALLTHCRIKTHSMRCAIQGGIRDSLVPRYVRDST